MLLFILWFLSYGFSVIMLYVRWCIVTVLYYICYLFLTVKEKKKVAGSYFFKWNSYLINSRFSFMTFFLQTHVPSGSNSILLLLVYYIFFTTREKTCCRELLPQRKPFRNVAWKLRRFSRSSQHSECIIVLQYCF